ncbi:DUF4191 domain-containing protein [Sanguibacter sp. HDW7]|uniref:DUF4191 domain-containing protein n=1 Tax=Sanguibacter sp. HDW7 TaxID=2714931 RepID=UPI001408C154|nr:DUF4191 domain-containing protein [Sanguibacter sp. HDW7]QIK83730.1 DUF4191 domain-containing protein [Sanguibacter sp. HDW7]
MARKKDDAAAPAQAATKKTKVKKRRWYHQVWDAYKMTVAQDPAVRWWILGTFVGILAVAVILGIVLKGLWFWVILGLPTAVLGAMFVLARRAERAAYARIEGQPGASLAALGTIRRGWTFDQEPVFIDPRTRDAVFRGVGRPGVVLFVEAPAARAPRVGEAERKRTARVLPNVPVTVVQVGREAGQVPLPKLVRHVTKLKPSINKHEISVVLKRLQSLGTARLPIPKGVDPMRMRVDRKGMRGR